MKQTLNRFWSRREYLSITLLWAVIVIALFWEALTADAGSVIGGNDIVYQFLPWLRFTVASTQGGSLPLWNPYVFSGTPFVGNPQPALFYPATWLAFWLGPEKTINVSVALHTWIAAFGMYGWMRAIGATRGGAFFASLAYALSGFSTARIWAGHYGLIMEVAWLPWLLWGVTCALRQRTFITAIARSIIAALPLGLMILAGNMSTLPFLLVIAAAFIAFEAIRAARSAGGFRPAAHLIGLFGLTIAVGGALAAVQILPTLTFIQNSARVAERSLEFASRFSLPPGHLLSMFVPDFFGEPITTGYWSVPVFEEYIYYVGVPTLILVALAVFIRDGRIRFFAALGAFGLLFALGPSGALYSIAYRIFPLLDLFRAPARAAMWTVFSFATVAGLCISVLHTSDIDATRSVLSKWSRLVIVVGVGAGLIVAGGAYALFAGFPSVPESARLYHLANDVVLFVVLFGATSALIKAWSARLDRAHVWVAALTVLLLLDLGIYNQRLLRLVPSTPGAVYEVAERALAERLETERFVWVGGDLFQLNGGMDLAQSNLYGYDPLIVARFQNLIERLGDLNSPIYDMLNVRYVISQVPIEETLERIENREGFAFYERPNAAPRVWLVHAVDAVESEELALERVAAADFDAQASAIIVGDVPCVIDTQIGVENVSLVRYEPNRIEAQVDASAAGMLVFSEIDYPGWAVWVDDEASTIQRVNYALRGVCLPRGLHRVTMVFDPAELKLGLGISAFALLTVAAAGVVLFKSRD